MKWNPWRLLTVAGIVAVVAVAGPVVPIKTTRHWCCPLSGSTRQLTLWFGGFPREVRETSALETWLKKRNPSFEPQFSRMSEQNSYLIGRSCAYAPAPEIYSIRSELALVVRTLDEKRITALLEVLRNGTRDQQRRAVSDIVDEAWEVELKTSPRR